MSEVRRLARLLGCVFVVVVLWTASVSYLITPQPQPQYVPLCAQRHGRLAAIPGSIVDCYRGAA